MNRFKALAMALMAMFALAAVAASSASATELALGPAFLLGLCQGPRFAATRQWGFLTGGECDDNVGEELVPAGFGYYVDRLRLEAGELAKVTTKNLGDFTLYAGASKPTTLCTGLTAPTSLLGGTPGLSETTIEFTGCEAPGGTGKCDSLNKGGTPGTIVVDAKDELVYVGKEAEAEKEEGHLGDLFTPAGGSNTFVTLEYLALSGSCPSGAVTTAVEGSVIGLVEPANSMSKEGMLTFPKTAIEKAWQWLSHGKVHEVKSTLKAFGLVSVTQLGLADLELESGGEWGVLTA